jgi:hypothetical protein
MSNLRAGDGAAAGNGAFGCPPACGTNVASPAITCKHRSYSIKSISIPAGFGIAGDGFAPAAPATFVRD